MDRDKKTKFLLVVKTVLNLLNFSCRNVKSLLGGLWDAQGLTAGATFIFQSKVMQRNHFECLK